MSVGTAIFLSSLVFATVILYGITKDRWGWRRMLKRTALAFAAIVALTGAMIGGLYFWNQFPIRLGPQNEYAGLRLGINPDEVMYIKGYPPSVLVEAPKPPTSSQRNIFDDLPIEVATSSLKDGKLVQDYPDWKYKTFQSSLYVTFDPKNRALIAITCYSDDQLRRCPPMAGVSDGDGEQEVIGKLGPAEESRIQGLLKYLSYDALGVQLTLFRDKVQTLHVNDLKYRCQGVLEYLPSRDCTEHAENVPRSFR